MAPKGPADEQGRRGSPQGHGPSSSPGPPPAPAHLSPTQQEGRQLCALEALSRAQGRQTPNSVQPPRSRAGTLPLTFPHAHVPPVREPDRPRYFLGRCPSDLPTAGAKEPRSPDPSFQRPCHQRSAEKPQGRVRSMERHPHEPAHCQERGPLSTRAPAGDERRDGEGSRGMEREGVGRRSRAGPPHVRRPSDQPSPRGSRQCTGGPASSPHRPPMASDTHTRGNV